MALQTSGGQAQKFRHRITNINLEPLTANYNISLKILVDGLETRRLPVIQRGASLTWDMALSCDVDLSSHVEIRVYEKHLLTAPRVGTLKYVVSTVADQLEASLEFDTKRFTAVLSFSTPEAAEQSAATALAEAQAKEKKTRLLERLGPTRDALKTILDLASAVSELHPAAKAALNVCRIAWDALEKQEQCDAGVEKLLVDLASMLPMVERVKMTATLPQLQDVVKTLMNLIEDASRFVIEYRTDGRPVQNLCAAVGSKAQDQVQDLRDKFQNLKESFDRGVGVQTLETVDVVHETVDIVHETIDAVHEVLLTNAQRALLNELKPVGSARYDSARACLPGTRTDIIKNIFNWSQKRDMFEGLLWVHGQAGLGKSSIATSICQELDGRKLLAAEFFCKRDSSERRDPQHVLTTIIYGLAFRHSGYAKSVADAIQVDPRLCSSPIQMQYDNLVKHPLETSCQAPLTANLVVIVDALDECGTTESRRQLLAYLYRMSQLAPWLKIIVTSRPDPDIQSFFESQVTSKISKQNVFEYNASNDISSFIQHRMLNSHESTHLPPDATHLLTKHADGLFIWAKTACELILNDHDPRSLFDLIIAGTGLDEGSNPLDALYTTAIQTSLGAGGERGAQYVRECLGAIIVCSTRTPLSVTNLSDLLGNQAKKSVLQSVVNRLGSVLYTDDTQGGAVRVYHHSFTDFMITSARSGRFCVDLERQNTDFARRCLQTMIDGLRFNICSLETSHVRNSQVSDLSTRVDASISLHLRYSCQYWSSHLTQSKTGELESLLREFLLQPTVLFWIEVLSLLGKLDAAMYSALELLNWCEGLNDVYQCARDIYRFVLAFYDPIAESTPHLYVSALAFCPTGTAFSLRLQPTFQNTLVITRGAEESWLPWLRCISHPAQVIAIAISKDGRRIVSGSRDRMVRLWDADTGVALGNPLLGHSGWVMSVEFSPDGRRIVSGSKDNTVRMWDADTSAAIGDPMVGHLDSVLSVGFSPDGRRIVSGSKDGTVRLWDAVTGRAFGNPLVGHSNWVHSVGFSPSGRRIVSGSYDSTVRIWDADTSAAIGDPLVGHSGPVFSVEFSPNSRCIVSGSKDNTVRLWDADTGAALGDPLEGHSDWVHSVGFSPDGRRIVSGSGDDTVRVWDADNGAALGDPLVGHSWPVKSVGFSPDGRRIFSGSQDRTVRVWDADTSAALGSPLIGHSETVWSVGFSPDGRRIVSGSSDGVRVWDADTGAALGDLLVGHSSAAVSVGFSPDGCRIFSGSLDSTVQLWDAVTGRAFGNPLVGHSNWVNSVDFSPDSRRVASGSSDNTVRVWDADTSAALGSPLVGHSDWVNSVAFSPNGRHIASGSDDRTVRLWDADTSRALGNPMVGHWDDVLSVGFSPDGRRIVSGSADKTVRVWDVDTGVALGGPLVGHSAAVNSVGFSPDGRRIISGSDDKTVRVWDTITGVALGKPLVGHSGSVLSVGFSPDGHRIVSGSDDETVRVWDSVPTLSASLPHSTSRMSDSLSRDGWVCNKATGALLIWLPEEYRRNTIDDSLFAISSDPIPRLVSIDSSRFMHGPGWESIYTP